MLVCVNHDLIYTYVDVALGGDGSQQPVIEPRPLSRIETRIAQTFVARLAAALKIAFEPFAATHFAPDGDIGGADPDRLWAALMLRSRLRDIGWRLGDAAVSSNWPFPMRS